MKIEKGTRLGPYEITGLIGAGGMGEVYRARDTRLGRDVAIKVVPPGFAHDTRTRLRLEREARAISSLAHPNICTLFDIGEENGVDYLVMEYLDGETLADITARGALPLDQVIRYGSQIADAVGAAHRQGIVHRDLKPGNIIITKSGVKVLDFGLATSRNDMAGDATEQKPLTEAGAVVGTLQYMAPEQLRGADADARSDMFALGAILYEMATGRRAFEGKNRTSVVASILETNPPSIGALQPMSPPALDHLIRKCLEKNPDDRMQSASDLAFALREITQPQALAPVRAKRTWMGLALFAIVLVGAVVASWMVARRRADTSAPKTIAVLPFSAVGIDKSREFLLLAIPDEIATILTYSPSLAVRPFSASRKINADADPQDAAKKLNAAAVVSGHLLDANGKINVTLEAIDVANDRLLWRDMFEVSSTDLVTMRGELSERIRSGLLPKLAGGAAVPEKSAPQNADAYGLYLRAAALPTDSDPNAAGLAMLEEAVRLDPHYAEAWSALSVRAYYDYSYHEGNASRWEQSEQAAARALEIDPNLIGAASQLITLRTERGDTIGALRAAKTLVAQRPSSAEAHFVFAYVLRYGGALEQSAAQCDEALRLDGSNRGFRSCARAYFELGQTKRTLQVAALDQGSVLSNRINIEVLINQGDYDRAIQLMPPGSKIRLLFEAWRRGDATAVQASAAALAQDTLARRDSEPLYALAGYVSLCGAPKHALDMLAASVQRNFCWVPAIDNNPIYDGVRALPEFAALHQQAAQCQERFLAELKK